MSKQVKDTMDRWQRALEGIRVCLDEISYDDPTREVVLAAYEAVWKKVVESREEYIKEYKKEVSELTNTPED